MLNNIYEFILCFEYDKGKTLNFDESINKGDYVQFYDIIDNFFGTELSHQHMKEVHRVYPELGDQLGYDKKEDEYDFMSLREIFERDFIVGGVEKIGDSKYKIIWGT